MGTTLDESLYYVNSTHILAHTGLRFYITFTHSLTARQVFAAVSKEIFSVDIDNNTIDSTLDIFYFIYFFLPIENFIFLCVSYFALFHLCCDLVSTSYLQFQESN